MLSFFKGLFPEPEKKKECIRTRNKDDGVSVDEVRCGGDIWPEPEIEEINGKKVLVYYCALHREHKYTEEEYKELVPPK